MITKLKIITFIAYWVLSDKEYGRRVRRYNEGFGFRFLWIDWR